MGVWYWPVPMNMSLRKKSGSPATAPAERRLFVSLSDAHQGMTTVFRFTAIISTVSTNIRSIIYILYKIYKNNIDSVKFTRYINNITYVTSDKFAFPYVVNSEDL